MKKKHHFLRSVKDFMLLHVRIKQPNSCSTCDVQCCRHVWFHVKEAPALSPLMDQSCPCPGIAKTHLTSGAGVCMIFWLSGVSQVSITGAGQFNSPSTELREGTYCLQIVHMKMRCATRIDMLACILEIGRTEENWCN
jgi:hypothetical protein